MAELRIHTLRPETVRHVAFSPGWAHRPAWWLALQPQG